MFCFMIWNATKEPVGIEPEEKKQGPVIVDFLVKKAMRLREYYLFILIALKN